MRKPGSAIHALVALFLSSCGGEPGGEPTEPPPPEPNLPDLLASGVAASDSTRAGDQVGVTFEYRNTGKEVAGGGGVNKVYLSSDRVVDVGDVVLGQFSREPLGPNGIIRESAQYLVPASTTDGEYNIGVVLDETNLIREGSEANNTGWAERKVKVIARPDLVVSHALYSRRMPNSGPYLETHEFIVGATIGNVGNAELTSEVSVQLYLVDSSTGTEYPVAKRRIAKVGTVQGEVFSIHKLGIPAGSYHGGARVDVDEEVLELNEANNFAKSNGYAAVY